MRSSCLPSLSPLPRCHPLTSCTDANVASLQLCTFLRLPIYFSVVAVLVLRLGYRFGRIFGSETSGVYPDVFGTALGCLPGRHQGSSPSMDPKMSSVLKIRTHLNSHHTLPSPTPLTAPNRNPFPFRRVWRVCVWTKRDGARKYGNAWHDCARCQIGDWRVEPCLS